MGIKDSGIDEFIKVIRQSSLNGPTLPRPINENSAERTVVLASSALCAVQHTTNSLIEIAALDCVPACTSMGSCSRSEGPVSLRLRRESVRGWCLYWFSRIFPYRRGGSFRYDHLRCNSLLLLLCFVHFESRFLSRCEDGINFCSALAHLEGCRKRQDYPEKVLCLHYLCSFCGLPVVQEQ